MLVPKLEINITDIGVSPNANVPAIVLLPVSKKPEHQCPRQKLAAGESHSNDARTEEWKPNLTPAQFIGDGAEGVDWREPASWR
jgi:hypothetical protein